MSECYFGSNYIFKLEEISDYQKVVEILEKAEISKKEITNFAKIFESFSKSGCLGIG